MKKSPKSASFDPPGYVTTVGVVGLLQWINYKGLACPDIFFLNSDSGFNTNIEDVITAALQTKPGVLEEALARENNMLVISTAVKQYFSQSKEPTIPFKVYSALVSILKKSNNVNKDTLIGQLMPITNQIEGNTKDTLSDLFAVLHNISSVTIAKLAYAITPVIMFPPVVTMESLTEQRLLSKAVEIMIENPSIFFGEAPHIPLLDDSHRERAISTFKADEELSKPVRISPLPSTAPSRYSPPPGAPNIPEKPNKITPPMIPPKPRAQTTTTQLPETTTVKPYKPPRRYSKESILRAPAPAPSINSTSSTTTSKINKDGDIPKLMEKLKKEISNLKDDLGQAISNMEYEKCPALRDLIQAKEVNLTEYEAISAELASQNSEAENEAIKNIAKLTLKVTQYQNYLDQAISNSEYEKCPELRDSIKQFETDIENYQAFLASKKKQTNETLKESKSKSDEEDRKKLELENLFVSLTKEKLETELVGLKSELEEAVASMAYEKCPELRDKILEVEGNLATLSVSTKTSKFQSSISAPTPKHNTTIEDRRKKDREFEEKRKKEEERKKKEEDKKKKEEEEKRKKEEEERRLEKEKEKQKLENDIAVLKWELDEAVSTMMYEKCADLRDKLSLAQKNLAALMGSVTKNSVTASKPPIAPISSYSSGKEDSLRPAGGMMLDIQNKSGALKKTQILTNNPISKSASAEGSLEFSLRKAITSNYNKLASGHDSGGSEDDAGDWEVETPSKEIKGRKRSITVPAANKVAMTFGKR